VHAPPVPPRRERAGPRGVAGPNAPLAPIPGDRGDGAGLPPAAFFIGLGLTAGAGALCAWSLLDTLSQRDAYVAAPAEAGYHDGIDAERRTVIIGSGAGVLAVTTLLVGIFWTRWHSRRTPRAAPSPVADLWAAPGGAGITLRIPLDGRF